VIGVNNFNCTGSAAITVTVMPLPQLQISSTPSAICLGDTATISAGGAVTYSWNNGIQTSSFTISPTSSTNFVVTGTDLNGCKSTAAIAPAILPKPDLKVNPSSATICKGETVTLVGSGASSYQWGGGTPGSPVFTANPSSSQSYTLTGQLSNGCSARLAYVLNVSDCLGIQTQVKKEVYIFPNPSDGKVNIKNESGEELIVEIYDVAGKLIQSTVVSATLSTWDSHLASGVYFLQLKYQRSADVQFLKLVVE
jgi:hypothetical protein